MSGFEEYPLNVTLSVSEDEQSSSFQNATLHTVNENIACSIAIYPYYPHEITTEQHAADYLKSKLAPLVEQGWKFEVQIGQSEPEE